MEEMNVNTPVEETKKLSYEELETIAIELRKNCNQLYVELQNANMNNAFKRLEFLFKVVKYVDRFPTEFVNACTKEIVDMMTLKAEEEA